MESVSRAGREDCWADGGVDRDSGLRRFLRRKQQGWLARQDRARNASDPTIDLAATVTIEGETGVRRIRIRDFQIISDSLEDFAGHDLGPASPEILLGALGSCIAHTFLIRAAAAGVALDAVEVLVTATGDVRAGMAEFDNVPVAPTGISYDLQVSSPADNAALDRLHREVVSTCPILALMREPQAIHGGLTRRA